MNVNVPNYARDHFFEEPPEGTTHEFWALRFRPPCQVGDILYFRFAGEIVATAMVARIEAPGQSKCESTGKFERGWKVIWSLDSFIDLRGKGLMKAANAARASRVKVPKIESPEQVEASEG